MIWMGWRGLLADELIEVDDKMDADEDDSSANAPFMSSLHVVTVTLRFFVGPKDWVVDDEKGDAKWI
jgi:hypothetical protein